MFPKSSFIKNVAFCFQINVGVRNAKAGLGLDSIPLPSVPDPKGRRKKEAWDKARNRFQNIPEPPPSTD